MPEVEMTAEAHDGLLLAGTLTLPDGPGPHPAVLLLHGSGPLDRDGNTRRQRLALGPPLAAALAQHGIATLRYDRRGVGATPGDWRATGFTVTRRDAAAALRALTARPDIQAAAVGVVGHSEGAVHAMALGAQSPDAAPAVAAVVLLAGFARTGEDALLRQAHMIARSLPRPVRKPLLALFTRYLARVKATSTDVARVAGMRVNARWMRELLTHDPRLDLANIRVPVLAVAGGKDIQVNPPTWTSSAASYPAGRRSTSSATSPTCCAATPARPRCASTPGNCVGRWTPNCSLRSPHGSLPGSTPP